MKRRKNRKAIRVSMKSVRKVQLKQIARGGKKRALNELFVHFRQWFNRHSFHGRRRSVV